MQKTSPNDRIWTRPELEKLGTMKDVAGAQTPRAQASGNVKS